jgi:methylisocitrate lyase
MTSFRSLVGSGRTLVAPGATDALSAKLIEAHGFWRTVQAFERAGVAAIHIEDHTGAGKHTSAPQTLRAASTMAARIEAAVKARTNPEFMIVARSDAFWVSRDLEDCLARLALYAEAGADMVFPTAVGPAELAEVRRRIDKPVMIVDMPGRTLEEHRGAAVVLYYAFSTLVQFEALSSALGKFKTGQHPGGQQALENFLGYR